MPTERARRAPRGFTLIEIAVGMAILGMGVVSALQVFGGSTQVVRIASRRSEAVIHARALMDSTLWVPTLREGDTHGEIGDGFRWVRNVRKAGPEDAVEPVEDEVEQPEIELAVITVVVEWNDPNGPKSYRIGTMRVVPRSEENQ